MLQLLCRHLGSMHTLHRPIYRPFFALAGFNITEDDAVHRNGVGVSPTKADKAGSLPTWLRGCGGLPTESHSRSRWPTTKARPAQPGCGVSKPKWWHRRGQPLFFVLVESLPVNARNFVSYTYSMQGGVRAFAVHVLREQLLVCNR